jgi:F-type H+-transporting ATPase subunit b
MATETAAASEHLTPMELEEAGICVDAGGSAIGMPQLCFEWYGNQIFWLIITLVVIYFILSRVALPRIAAILAERQGTITNAIANAEDLKAKAAEAEDAYNKALADARSEAQKIAAENKAKIQAELDDAIAKADAEIGAKTAESEKAIAEIREGALESVREVANDTAQAIVSALGGKAKSKTVTDAVAERMKGQSS